MTEDLLHLDVDHEPRCASIDGAGVAQRVVSRQACGAVDTQRLGDPGDQEQQPDAGSLQQVAHPVETAVAGELGDHEPPVAQHPDEPRRASLRRGVGRPVGGTRRHHQERSGTDERDRALVERGGLLRDHPRQRLAHDRTKSGNALDVGVSRCRHPGKATTRGRRIR
jgi:hypothetical protein